jgi:hypothetical protein
VDQSSVNRLAWHRNELTSDKDSYIGFVYQKLPVTCRHDFFQAPCTLSTAVWKKYFRAVFHLIFLPLFVTAPFSPLDFPRNFNATLPLLSTYKCLLAYWTVFKHGTISYRFSSMTKTSSQNFSLLRPSSTSVGHLDPLLEIQTQVCLPLSPLKALDITLSSLKVLILPHGVILMSRHIYTQDSCPPFTSTQFNQRYVLTPSKLNYFLLSKVHVSNLSSILLFVEYPEQGRDIADAWILMAEIVGSAVVQESVSQIVSGILQKYDEKQNSNAFRNLFF